MSEETVGIVKDIRCHHDMRLDMWKVLPEGLTYSTQTPLSSNTVVFERVFWGLFPSKFLLKSVQFSDNHCICAVRVSLWCSGVVASCHCDWGSIVGSNVYQDLLRIVCKIGC